MNLYRATRSWLAMARNWTNEQRDSDRRRAVQLVKEHMHLPKNLPAVPKRRGSVWAISIVKNEADVIRLTVLHQLEQGVDAVLVADNGSTDGTLDILHELAAEYPVHVATDAWPVWDQAVKTTYLANVARRAGADWVVPFDADEFWFARGTSVAEHLRRSRASLLYAQIYNLFPLGDTCEAPLRVRTTFRFDLVPHRQGKAVFRSHVMASVRAGNHHVVRWGPRETSLQVAHLPWRSFEQMRRKTTEGSIAIARAGLPKSVGIHWTTLAELPADQLLVRWRQITAGEPAEDTSWTPVGPFLELAPLMWRTWDPDGVIS